MQTKTKTKKVGFSLIEVMVIVAISSIISALAIGVILYNNNKITPKVTYKELMSDENLNQFLEVYANLSSDYYESIDKKAMLQRAISAMMNYLGDDYIILLACDLLILK